MQGTKLTAEQRAYVNALHDSGEHLLNLVNDMLDFAKLGAGRVELHPAPTDLEALLQGVSELLSPRAREKGLEIAWARADAPPVIRADEGRLRQILLNFAGNAVKFTDRGGVLVSVSSPTAGRLRFAVQDTGPGVSTADRERIFEAFAQSDIGRADLGGTGLGLAIARRLAHSMGGEVGVETPVSGGARFWFEASFPPAAGRAFEAELAGRSVGIVSPNPMVLRAAQMQVEASGGRAVCGADAPDVARRLAPGDAMLFDAGLAAEGALRPSPNHPGIVMLAPEERGRLTRYRRAGFVGYLIKPLRRASLAERVLIATGASADACDSREDERIAEAAAPGLRVLLVEDNPINALLARTLLTREGCIVEHVASGEDALKAVGVGAFDLILMDMRMPGLSGEETARRMRTAGVTTAIVALTANAFEDDRHACLAAGMNDFLVKPLSPDALRLALTRWSAEPWTRAPERRKVG